MTEPRVYLMPMSHLDLFWLGEREECLSRGNRVITRAMQIADQYPNFRYLLEDMDFVKNFVLSHPEKQADLKRLVQNGQIEISPKYAGIYENMIPGEAHVRNFMIGKKLAHELFDVDPTTAHQGDLPAHTPQYPQILRKSGVTRTILCRLGPNAIPLFQWQGLDGSRVLTWYSTNSYVWAWRVLLHESVEQARERGIDEQLREILGQTPTPILMHWGMDLMLPTEKLIENVTRWNDESDLTMQFATAQDFFDAVEDAPNLPVVEGESPNGWGIRGSDAGHRDGRYLDFWAVSALLNAERFSTISNLLGYASYPDADIEQAWMYLLESMDHNANGTGAQEGDRRHNEYRRMAKFMGEEMLRRALRPIAENVAVPKKQDIFPLVVFNGTSWQRTDVAEGHISIHGDISAFQKGHYKTLAMFDADGNAVPMQTFEVIEKTTREIRVAFPVQVPSVGYATYYVMPVEEEPNWPATCIVTEEEGTAGRIQPCGWLQLETEDLIFRIDRLTGYASLFDKALNRWMVEGASLYGEETQIAKVGIFEHFPTGRIYEYLLDSVELVENGPVRARVRVNGRVSGLAVTQEWLIYRGMRRIDLSVEVHGTGEIIPMELQQSFPLKVEDGHVNFGVPFGTNNLENIMPQMEPQLHNPDEANPEYWRNLREIQNWVDLSNRTYGLTLSSNHRMMEIKTPVFNAKLSHVSSKAVPRTYYFQLMPHEGDWKQAESYRQGWQLATPLQVLSVNDPVTEKSLPATQSFCQISAENVVLTALKRSQDGQRLVWRGYEATGEATKTELVFFEPVRDAYKTNLLEVNEEPVSLQGISVSPFEIVTVAAKAR